MASANVRLVERAFDAFNERSVEGFEDLVVDDFDWVTPTATNGEPRTYRGVAGIQEFWEDASAWEAIEGRVREIRDFGDRALVLGELRWRDPRGESFDAVGPLSSVVRFDGGRIIVGADRHGYPIVAGGRLTSH